MTGQRGSTEAQPLSSTEISLSVRFASELSVGSAAASATTVPQSDVSSGQCCFRHAIQVLNLPNNSPAHKSQNLRVYPLRNSAKDNSQQQTALYRSSSVDGEVEDDSQCIPTSRQNR